MSGSGWCVQTLNDDDAYVSKNHCCTSATLLGLTLKGKAVGAGGGADLFKQPHAASSLPLWSNCGTCGGVVDWLECGVWRKVDCDTPDPEFKGVLLSLEGWGLVRVGSNPVGMGEPNPTMGGVTVFCDFLFP